MSSYSRAVVWVFIAAAAVFIPIGIAVFRNPEAWSSMIRASQQRYLGPGARPDDQIDDRDIFGNDKASSRVLSMQITGIVFIVVPVAGVLTAIFTR